MARLLLATPAGLAAAVAVAVLALAAGVALQQAPAAAPAAGDCSAAVTSLAGCLPYVTPGSTQSKPPKECCDGVKSAISSPAAVQCLCAALGQNYGIQLNMTRAAGLPAACGGNPAAFSKCNIKLPGGAPAEAPAPTSAGSTPAAGTPGGSNSAATRSPISAIAVVAAVAAPLFSYYYL